MYIYYREKTGEVVMRTPEKIRAKGLMCKEIEPTADEMVKIEQNYTTLVKDDKLELVEPEHVTKEKDKESIKQQLKEAKSVGELKTLIQILLDK